MPLTQPEKYSCYALFCFRATTSSLWHLAVIREKPWIPHISTVDSDRCTTLDPNSTPTLCCTVRLPHSCRTMLGFRQNAWGPFTLPITSICNANDRVTECVSLWQRGCVFSMHLCPPQIFIFFSPFLQIFLCLFPRLCSCVGGTSEAPSKLQTSKRSRVAQLCGEWSANPVENVIWKIVYNVSFVVAPSDVHCAGEGSTSPTEGTAAVGQFLSLCQQLPFSFRLPFSTERLRAVCLLPQQLYRKPQDSFHSQKCS